MNRKDYIERILNLLIVVAAVGCAIAWAGYFTSTPSAPGPQYAVGESVTDVPELAHLAGKPTLVLYVNSACPICTESMAFYEKLIEARHAHESELQIVAASRESLDSLKRYLAEHGLPNMEAVQIADRSPFKVTLTPTLLLLDGRSDISQVWLGRLGQEREAEVLAVVTQTPSATSAVDAIRSN
jgi:hypothetical protein